MKPINDKIEEIAESNDESWRKFRLYYTLYDKKLAEMKHKDTPNTVYIFRQLETKPKITLELNDE